MEEQQNNLVDDHKKMLIFSGKLSDFQLKNLKQWPFVVFDNIDSATVDYNFGENNGMLGDAGSVTYVIMRKDKEKEEDDFENKKDTLSNWVKFMFWKETKVVVKYGN